MLEEIEKLKAPEITYILSLLEFRELIIKLESEIFNTMDYIEYKLTLLKILKEKCHIVIKDYTVV